MTEFGQTQSRRRRICLAVKTSSFRFIWPCATPLYRRKPTLNQNQTLPGLLFPVTISY